jgi:hypothetical protein
MTLILITNAITSGVAVLAFAGAAALRRRHRRQRVQRIYLTLDGRRVTRDEQLGS